MAIDIVAYIEKDVYEAPGVCVTDICKTETAVTSDPKLNTVTVSVPVMRKGDVVNKKMVNVHIIKTGQTQISCMLCQKHCVETTAPPLPTALQAGGIILIKSTGQPQLPATHAGQGCAPGCPREIKWAENYDHIQRPTFNQQTGQMVMQSFNKSRYTITTEVDIPQICGLTALSFAFEISPCYSFWDLTKTRSSAIQVGQTTPPWLWQQNLQGIPADNSLRWTYGDKWSIDWHFTSADVCFFPGESMAVYGTIKDPTGKCNQVLLGYGWFENNCLTSGDHTGLRHRQEKHLSGAQGTGGRR